MSTPSLPPSTPGGAAPAGGAGAPGGGAGGDPPKPDAAATSTGGEGAATTDGGDVKMEEQEPVEEPLPDEIVNGTPEDIMTRVRLIDNELKVRFPLLLLSKGVSGMGQWKVVGLGYCSSMKWITRAA